MANQQTARKHASPAVKYGYSTARVHAMKVKLFPRETYAKVLLMDLPEITRFIEESEYKAEVDELARMHAGIDLVEFAIHLNMARTFTKLIEITTGEPHFLIIEYLRRWDIWNIKTILRGKLYGATEQEILSVLVPSGELSIEFLQSLVRKKTVEEVIDALKGTIYYNEIKNIDYTQSSAQLEDELDKFYYRRMLEVAEMTGNSLFLNVIRIEIDIANLKTLFRLKNAGISGSRALEYILPGGLYFTDREVRKMATAPFEEFVGMVSTSRYWRAISEVVKEHVESLSIIELRLDKYLSEHVWRTSTSRPLTILPILGYMLSKYVEVENIRAIARGKEAGLSQEAIKAHLVL